MDSRADESHAMALELVGEKLDVALTRKRFPGLAQSQVFLDNAGGTQALDTVISSYAHL